MTENSGHILVVDDDMVVRRVIVEALRRDGHRVSEAATLAALSATLAADTPDAVISDVFLPDGDGLTELPGLFEDYPDIPVIVVSAQNTLKTAVRATEQGAFDYLPKPFDLDELSATVRAALASRSDGAGGVRADTTDLPLIGASEAMQRVYRMIARLVGNDLTVLISGESGTGKELVARAIHDLGPRSKAPFIAINMAAIPRELIESELFGHERGAFTGAQARAAGRFEQADGGTLFLDEIGDMPLEAQTRLLRVLQTGEVTPVGSARPLNTNVRILAATHVDLAAMVEAKRFREDLYYRLNVVPIQLPALRERSDDIPALAAHFLADAEKMGLPSKRFSAEATGKLMAHSWPGNVRELENLVRRLLVTVREDVISGVAIDHSLSNSGVVNATPSDALSVSQVVERWAKTLFAADPSVEDAHSACLAEVEPPLLRAALRAARGNQIRAAQMLGINRNTLRKKLTAYGISSKESV